MKQTSNELKQIIEQIYELTARLGGVDIFLDIPKPLSLGSYGIRWDSSIPAIF